jgi:hypothetical protein
VSFQIPDPVADVFVENLGARSASSIAPAPGVQGTDDLADSQVQRGVKA